MQPRAERRHEQPIASGNGYTMSALALILIAAGLYGLLGLRGPGPVPLVAEALLVVLGIFVLAGLYMLQPNESAILTLFGQYIGGDRAEGLRWANPFYRKRHISLRARNLNAPTLKVNDKRGNPVEISAVVVWRLCCARTTTPSRSSTRARCTTEVDAAGIHIPMAAVETAAVLMRHPVSRG